LKEKESESETIFVVQFTLNGRSARTGIAEQKKLSAFIRASNKDVVESRLKAMGLPGTFRVEPAILCTPDRITMEILRQAKMARFEFGFTSSDEAAE
jgi:hypothetical protein